MQSSQSINHNPVGFAQIGAESGWRTANTESIKSEAAKRGINLKFADAQRKQENQIKALRIVVGFLVLLFILLQNGDSAISKRFGGKLGAAT